MIIKNIQYGFAIFLMSVLFPALKAQECTAYFPSKEGTELVYQYFDAKAKPTYTMTYKVMETKNTDKGLQIKTEEWIETPDHPAKDTVLLDFYCNGEVFYIDMKKYLSQFDLDKYKGMEMNVKTTNQGIPAHPKSGSTLPGADVSIEISKNGGEIITVSISMSNRKVEGFEKVTTPAGTFNCFKISYNIETRIGFLKKHYKAAEWYTKDIGKVKTEKYNKNGKLTGASQLVKILN